MNNFATNNDYDFADFNIQLNGCGEIIPVESNNKPFISTPLDPIRI